MKTILLLLSLTLGVFLPYGHSYDFLIRYFLMAMLLFAFLDIKINREMIHKSHFAILAINIIVPVVVFYAVKPFHIHLAETAFITAIAPTAVAAPVVITLLKKKIEYVIFSVLLTNFAIALLVPLLLPEMLDGTHGISVMQVLVPVLVTFLVPLVTALFVKRFVRPAYEFLYKIKGTAFYLLVINIYIGTSKASHFVQEEMAAEIEVVFYIALITLAICALYFAVGWLLGGKQFNQEASQSLGQKNNSFTIWLSLTFVSPLAALGPVFYVLIQNVYISSQLYKKGKAPQS